ncbi:MAG: PPC domain-containing protein [Deltaproteobacteria bacterium]|nr:PPC domain-containing protein [Deltaproteobacteria bacterium]
MKKLVLIALLVGCAGEDAISLDDEWGMDGPVFPTPPPGKEDSELRKGLLVSTDTSRTQVWTARNKWEDTSTTAAKAAGLAWSADSNLTWDAKYAAWVQSLEWIPALDGFSTTVRVTTPWGKTLPSPSLECAEMSLFLRITFAAWYELPLFFESVDSTGARVFFGHNGVRTAAGRYASSPEFAIKYKDLSKSTTWMQTWPVDATLRAKRVAGGDDIQNMIATGAKFGAYLDEIHLNKRAGYFTVMALDYLGSMNIADSSNAYNIIPDDVRAGDTLIERWQKNGIGHTLVVKEVAELPGGSKDVTTISGSMPRRQGVRQSGQSSKSYFTSNYTGGVGTAADGNDYAKLGGGIKRWRVAKNVNGYWTNTWMAADEASWINSTDYARISARPARFEQILGQVSPEQKRTELLVQIGEARHHLQQFPASCSARERREQAFRNLYEVGTELGQSKGEIDAEHRELEDYVLGELEYTKSKTCCWNSTTSAMYDIVMDKARAEIAAAEATNTCVAPTVFASRTDGYGMWAAHAATLGRPADWRAWSEDEACPQRGVAADTERSREATTYCSLDDGGTTTCTDAMEPNNSRAAAVAATGSIADLQICAADEDWYKVSAAGTVKVDFRHADGDLDLEAFDAAGAKVDSSAGTSNTEDVAVPAGGFVRVFGFSGARGAYTLTAP